MFKQAINSRLMYRQSLVSLFKKGLSSAIRHSGSDQVLASEHPTNPRADGTLVFPLLGQLNRQDFKEEEVVLYIQQSPSY